MFAFSLCPWLGLLWGLLAHRARALARLGVWSTFVFNNPKQQLLDLFLSAFVSLIPSVAHRVGIDVHEAWSVTAVGQTESRSTLKYGGPTRNTATRVLAATYPLLETSYNAGRRYTSLVISWYGLRNTLASTHETVVKISVHQMNSNQAG